MRQKLDKELLETLYSQNISYKEIAQRTGYSENSVNVYFWRTKGRMVDISKFRRTAIPISQAQREILFGTLMGDGNIQKQKVAGYLGRYNHSASQLAYCRHIAELLGDLVSPVREYTKVTATKSYDGCYFTLLNNINLKEFHDMFYRPKKDVPLNLELLTPRAMAFWFMDDGTASGRCSISIATCSFSLEGLLRLKDYLHTRYGLSVTINREFKLCFSAESGRKFYDLVKDYILPEMMYKFRFVDTCSSKTP